MTHNGSHIFNNGKSTLLYFHWSFSSHRILNFTHGAKSEMVQSERAQATCCDHEFPLLQVAGEKEVLESMNKIGDN